MSTTDGTEYGSLYFVLNTRFNTYVNKPTQRMSRAFSIIHQDSVKRKRPVGKVALFLAGTSYSHESLMITNGTFQYNDGVYLTQMQLDQISGFGWSSYEPINWNTTTPVDELQSKLLSKARGEGVNLATMLGEYKDTAELFCSLAQDFVKLTVALKRADPRYLIYGRYYASGKLRCPWPRTFIKECSDRWLQYVWGVDPLIKDMQEAWKQFRETPLDPLFKVVRASTSRNAFTSVTRNYNQYVSYTDSSVANVQYSGRALVFFNDTLLSNTLAKTGFTNPLAVAYELTPFSWLIDYWCNLGSVIGSLDSALIFKSVDWNFTKRYRYRLYRSALSCKGVVIMDKTSRSATSTLSTTPPLYYKESVSSRHVANVLAVLQGFRK